MSFIWFDIYFLKFTWRYLRLRTLFAWPQRRTTRARTWNSLSFNHNFMLLHWKFNGNWMDFDENHWDLRKIHHIFKAFRSLFALEDVADDAQGPARFYYDMTLYTGQNQPFSAEKQVKMSENESKWVRICMKSQGNWKNFNWISMKSSAEGPTSMAAPPWWATASLRAPPWISRRTLFQLFTLKVY